MGLIHTLTVCLVVIGLLGSCAVAERARMYGVEYAARAVLLECALSLAERKQNVDGINGWLLANSTTARALALDCDGDGMSDF